ncbi:MAG TPA: hypothetical protein P5210_03125 [Draconibacterium sp.]|nr:hypothetical protein [Draconibacterium sp.]
MKFSNLKITAFLTISVVVLLTSCEIEDFNIDPLSERKEEFLFQTEKAFCECDPENEIWAKSFEYDISGNLIETKIFNQGNPDIKVKSDFNLNSRKLTDSTFYYIENNWKYVNSNQYIYSGNQLKEIQKYEADGKNTYKIVYRYNGTKPKYEEFYSFYGDKWEFQYSYGFEFDRNGNLTKKSSYKSIEKTEVYDQFIYKYKNGFLVEERRIIRTGETSYIKTFSYNSDGFRDETIENGNVVEKNFYEEGKLIEKQTFYFGIDPGFSACYGNFIYRYSY